MRRTAICLLLITCFLISGCQQGAKNVFHVMFAEVPNLWETSVHADGVVIGTIVARNQRPDYSEEIQVTIQNEYLSSMRRNMVFIADSGSLVATTVSGDDSGLEPGAQLAGFTSTSEFFWFKVKGLLGNTADKAAARASELYERYP